MRLLSVDGLDLGIFSIMLSIMWVAMILSAAVLSQPLFPEDLPRRVGSWDPKILGNHRIVIQVEAGIGDQHVVRVHIPWRRRDQHPNQIDTVITDAGGHRITNVFRKEIRREFGELAFEPRTGSGTYYLYHLPHVTHGTYYPSVEYTHPSSTADTEWTRAVLSRPWDDLPEAKPEWFESVSILDAFTPMEVIASADEADRLRAQHPSEDFLVFPEDRHLSIRMRTDIPYRWAIRGANSPFEGTARRGEYYSFQLGVWAQKADLKGLAVRFSALSMGRTKGKAIPASSITCYNTTGIDYRGNPFSVDVEVAKGQVQPLWCGIDVPLDSEPGTYTGYAVIAATGKADVHIPISLIVRKEIAKDHGDDQPEDMTRLRWLNSKIGQDETVVKPFQSSGLLGCSVALNERGFFEQVTRSITKPTTSLLAKPMRLEIEGDSGILTEKTLSKPIKRKQSTTSYSWSQKSSFGPIEKHLRGSLQFDGTADFLVELDCIEDCHINDIRLEIPLRKDVARYFMGLGRSGGKSPESLDWKWDVQNNQEGAWVGSVDCGMMFALRDERYVRPLNTNFYHEKPLIMPSSWENGGQGGIRIRTDGDAYTLTCYSGPRSLKKNEKLHFNLHMMLTPFKPIDTRRQFSERYYHSYKPLGEIQKDGANVINVHHATEINPWINYPFLGFDKLTPGGESGPAAKMKEYVTEAHRRGMKVKIYDTIRELSNRAPELFMLRSLGHEVFSSGKGGGGSWLREHLEDDYIGAWHATEVGDASIVNSGMSRWHNYYVEGLDWLARNIGIDGLYLDDVAFDRVTMLRVRRVLEKRITERAATTTDESPSQPIIDLHSANQHNPRDGWNNSALLYMDLMPFLDRLWFGEYFDYSKGPDYYLVEVSGIPFGLMGEMLQDGGNPWRGMLFGMTSRRPWAGDPRPLWKFWDEFGIKDSKMIGWWNDKCPVKTNNKDVVATVYHHHPDGGRPTAIIAIASWAQSEVSFKLNIDWKALGIDPKKVTLIAKSIENFQTSQSFEVSEAIPVKPGKGWLLTLAER